MNDDNDRSKVVEIAGPRRPPNAGAGRKKGVPNKTTASLKTMITGALDELGGQAWLIEQARSDPRAFMALLSKLVPREIDLDASIAASEPVTMIRRVIVDPRAIEQEQTP